MKIDLSAKTAVVHRVHGWYRLRHRQASRDAGPSCGDRPHTSQPSTKRSLHLVGVNREAVRTRGSRCIHVLSRRALPIPGTCAATRGWIDPKHGPARAKHRQRIAATEGGRRVALRWRSVPGWTAIQIGRRGRPRSWAGQDSLYVQPGPMICQCWRDVHAVLSITNAFAANVISKWGRRAVPIRIFNGSTTLTPPYDRTRCDAGS